MTRSSRKQPASSAKLNAKKQFHVVVIGAGLAGIAAAYKLRAAGITDVVVLEKSDRVGGTWRENTYPGCGVDIASPVYSFSFHPNPHWTRTFARQPEILAYIEDTVTKFDLLRDIRFGVELLDAAWSDDERRWLLRTTTGDIHARHVIFAAGPINEPRIPTIPGLDQFAGEVFHSARWNHEIDLTGKRVAVIGTGASSVQFTPEIAPIVQQLIVFQRSPAWVVPRFDLPFPTAVRTAFDKFPAAQRAVRVGVDTALRTVTMFMRRDRAARTLNPIGRAMLHAQVSDPQLRRELTPSFTFGCKRLLLSNDYLPMFARPNVELVPSALVAADAHHVVAADGSTYAADIIIFGTGFDVSHPPILSRVRTRDGRLLSDRFQRSGAEAYLGTAVPGVPNAFLVIGPNVVIYNSFLAIAEAQLDYIVDAITTASRDKIDVLEVRADVVRHFNDQVQDALRPTVFNSGGCASYFLDETGRNFAVWPWSTSALRRRLGRFDLADYTTVPALSSTSIPTDDDATAQHGVRTNV